MSIGCCSGWWLPGADARRAGLDAGRANIPDKTGTVCRDCQDCAHGGPGSRTAMSAIITASPGTAPGSPSGHSGHTARASRAGPEPRPPSRQAGAPQDQTRLTRRPAPPPNNRVTASFPASHVRNPRSLDNVRAFVPVRGCGGWWCGAWTSQGRKHARHPGRRGQKSREGPVPIT
jgi:hypothetical protein